MKKVHFGSGRETKMIENRLLPQRRKFGEVNTSYRPPLLFSIRHFVHQSQVCLGFEGRRKLLWHNGFDDGGLVGIRKRKVGSSRALRLQIRTAIAGLKRMVLIMSKQVSERIQGNARGKSGKVMQYDFRFAPPSQVLNEWF